MAADQREEPKGWEPQDERKLWDRGDGRGAETGNDGGLGAREAAGSGGTLPNGDDAAARQGEPRDEHSRIGWGEEAEHYPSADGPPGSTGDRD